MSNEFQDLIHVIKDLKPEDNPLKDYFFPIVISFVSSFMGALFAYFVFKRQDWLIFEKEKLNTINKVMITAINVFHELSRIKGDYADRVNKDSNPIQRALVFPPLAARTQTISFPLELMTFIAPHKKNGKPEYPKWSQIPIFSALSRNFNIIVDIIEKRNLLDLEIKKSLMQAHRERGYTGDGVDPQILHETIKREDLGNWIILTEKIIVLVDDLIVEFNDLLHHFPSYVRSKIKMDKIKNYGGIVTFNHANNSTLFLEKIIPPDYEIVAALLGVEVDEAKSILSTGYEVI